MNTLGSPINFMKWIEDNRHLLKPPVGNKCVWEDGDFIVMVVGGPNSRKDFHYNETPEFFYQIEGGINLVIQENGAVRNIRINEGEIFLLPPKVPHSPQRGADTVGLVIEYKRPEGMMDALLWYCESCNTQLHNEPFSLKNIEVDLPIAFNKFYNDTSKCTCSKCGAVMKAPKKIQS